MTEKLVASLIQNGPLVVALGVLYWKATPYLIRMSLQNGSGEVVKQIVQSANLEQSLHHAKELGKLGERIAVLEARVKDRGAA